MTWARWLDDDSNPPRGAALTTGCGARISAPASGACSAASPQFGSRHDRPRRRARPENPALVNPRASR
jgi:hypothetical protein